jgi:hypothetical protein
VGVRSAHASGLLLIVAGYACGSSSATPAPAPPETAGFADAGVDAGPPECTESTKDVFVLSEELTLYSFHPPTLEFKSVGALRCATSSGATPTSMAVDRHGFAWVRYSDGTLWKLSTVDLSCAATAYAPPGATDPFYKFGMGFASASAGSSDETLFLSDAAGHGTASLDLATMKTTFIGPYTGAQANQRAELTGTGDGKLYAMFVTTEAAPSQIAEVSKTTGGIVSVDVLPTVVPGDAYAFSFYGGDFYLYTHTAGSLDGGAGAGGVGSDVTRCRPSDKSVTVVKSAVGFKIVGAGVSTCAPTVDVR